MRSQDRVTEIVIRSPEVVSCMRPVGHDWRSWKRCHWLERVAKAVWLWFATAHKERIGMLATVTIDLGAEGTLGAIAKAYDSFRACGYEPKTLLIGPRVVMADLEAEEFAHSVSLGFKELDMIQSGAWRRLGLDTYLVPWIDGVVMLPDLEKLREINQSE